MRFRVAVMLVVAGTLQACAAAPGPGDPGYPYNLSGTYTIRLSVQGMSFSGTAELETRPGGAISGTLRLTSPYSVTGDITGTVVGDQATLITEYEVPSMGCVGATRSTGAVEEGGTRMQGNLSVDDSCGGMMTGRTTLTRRP